MIALLILLYVVAAIAAVENVQRAFFVICYKCHSIEGGERKKNMVNVTYDSSKEAHRSKITRRQYSVIDYNSIVKVMLKCMINDS